MALGATPSQVFIDGIDQLEAPYIVSKPKTYQRTPRRPNFNIDAQKAVNYEGLPPLAPKKSPIDTTIIFKNVKSLYQRKSGVIEQALFPQETGNFSTIIIRNGSIICSGDELCSKVAPWDPASLLTIDLEGGSISPGFVSFGSPLGLENMGQEPSTNDGIINDHLLYSIPDILGNSATIHAVDGLEYGSRDALYVQFHMVILVIENLKLMAALTCSLAYRAGVSSSCRCLAGVDE